MATYVLLTKLSAQSLGTPSKRENIGRQWLDEVKAKCPEVKWLEHFALLGPFDFMDIYRHWTRKSPRRSPDHNVERRREMRLTALP
jgi:hypothetical protein